MRTCEKCEGTGLITKGIWRFKRSERCEKCSGSGEIMEFDDRDPKAEPFDGDIPRMQEIFHIMAKARKLAQDAEKKGKHTFDVHNNLKKAQRLLKENDYNGALEKAKEALALAEKFGVPKT